MKTRLHSCSLVGLGLVTLTLISCGGSGGGDTPVDPLAGLSQLRVDVASLSGISLDPSNLFVGETVRFRIAGRSANGSLVQANVTGWSSNAPVSAGTLRSDGTFQVGSPTSSDFTVTFVYNGTTYSALVRVLSPQAVLSGRIRTNTGFGVSRVAVVGFNSAGAEVVRAFSAVDGRVRFSIPPTATRFKLDFSTVDPSASTYVRQFAYNGIDYSTVINGCVAPLPGLVNGQVSNLATEVVIYPVSSSNPPPPPDGCNP